jgi:hypothetical protein
MDHSHRGVPSNRRMGLFGRRGHLVPHRVDSRHWHLVWVVLMHPTLHLRFVERMEIINQNLEDGTIVRRPTKVLQQFWETPHGKEAAGDMFTQIYGKWIDIPLIKGD